LNGQLGWLVALCIGCSSTASAPVDADTGVADEDAADALPPLDPKSCGEAPPLEDVRFDPTFVAASSGDALTDREFPLLVRVGATARLDDRVKKLASACDDLGCLAWTDTELASAVDAIATAVDVSSVAHDMRASGDFALHAALEDAALVKQGLRDELAAAAKTIADHGGELDASGKKKALDLARGSTFEPTAALAISVLKTAGRDEAVRHAAENAATLAKIATIAFTDYAFPVIVVPGLGPTDLETPLSEGGKQRCDLAAERYRAKLAPIVLVSGGHVHPDRTPYSEAIEMKRYLIDVQKLPPDAILVDAWARHTTTNLRNAARLMIRARIPVNRPSLVTSDPFQSLYVVGNPFAKRCDDELGYRPFRALPALSVNDGCFFPSMLSLQNDARDALDP
jgi:hypothetical protein